MLTVHLRIADAVSKKPTPVRLRIADEQGNEYVPFGRLTAFPTGVGEQVGGQVRLPGSGLHTSADARLDKVNWSYIDGSCELALPAGIPLRIQATKGPEYLPLDRTVTLGAGQMALRFEMARWCDTKSAGWMTGDSRAHFLTPHDALLEAAAEDLDVVNLLARWHTTLAQDGNTYVTLTNLTAFSGQSPLLSNVGRYLVVNTLNQHRALGRVSLLSAHRVVYPLAFGEPEGTDDWSLCGWCDQCHRKNGLVVWVDAFRSDTGVVGGEAFIALLLGKIDAIEFDAQPRKEPLLPWLYHLWNAGVFVPVVGGSGKDDNRVPLGAMRTYAFVRDSESKDYHAWIEAVREGRTYVTNGPIVDFTMSSERPLIRAVARSMSAFDRLEIIHNGKVVGAVRSIFGPPHTADLEIEIAPGARGWIAARCVGANGVFAHTSAQRLLPNEPDTSALSALTRLVEQTEEWCRERGQYQDQRNQELLLNNAKQARELLIQRPGGDPIA